MNPSEDVQCRELGKTVVLNIVICHFKAMRGRESENILPQRTFEDGALRPTNILRGKLKGQSQKVGREGNQKR